MALSVSGAFTQFRRDYVDIDKDTTDTARSSRGYLVNQLTGLSRSVVGMPSLTGDYLSFGSFARSTKRAPLDDIDLMMFIDCDGREEQIRGRPYTSRLIVGTHSPLYPFADSAGVVNSTRVLNKLRDSLGTVPNYGRADIHRKQQAVALKLTSYTWSYDIVPAVEVSQVLGGKAMYFVIPDGSGSWMPRIRGATANT